MTINAIAGGNYMIEKRDILKCYDGNIVIIQDNIYEQLKIQFFSIEETFHFDNFKIKVR